MESIEFTILEYSNFILIFPDQDFEYSCDFEVYEIITPEEKELYLTGQIKWDGCSHVYPNPDLGGFHLCGKYYWEVHNELMKFIWDTCTKKIIKFDTIESK